MKKLLDVAVIVYFLCLLSAADWRQFRGNAHNTVADTTLPDSWDVATKKNIAWQIDLPGRGPSSPILVKDRVILTASDGPRQDKLFVLAFNAASGKELWRRQFWATGRTLCHPESAIAAPTPASDGERIFAFYSSNDLACLDLDGNLLWYRGLALDYPKAGNDVGMSSSPVVVGDTVIVQVDNQGDAFAAGLDTATGEERWRLPREKMASWSSPVAVRTKNGVQVILQNMEQLTAVSPRDGKIEWTYELPANDITSTVVIEDRLFVPGNGITALDLSTGSSEPEVLWESNKIGISGASPVIHNGALYSFNRAGVLACADTKNGNLLWQLRLKGSAWSTPIIAGNRLYLTNFDGLAHFIQLGDKPSTQGKLLGTSDFGERIEGTPAVGDKCLYFRSDKHLWKIAE